jgi:hypothetical protein
MGERGWKLASENYDFDHYIQGLESLFARVATERQVVRGEAGSELA